MVTQANISDRPKAEDALRFHSKLLDIVEQAVIAIDLSGTVIYCNGFAEQLYDWPANELLGKSIDQLFPAERMRNRAADIMSRLVAGRSWSGEFTVQRRDGTTFPAFITDTPIYDDDGTIVGIVGISYSIADRNRAEKDLHDSERRFGALIDQATVGVAHADLEGRFIQVNEKYCRITGYSEQELLGMRMQDLTHPDDLTHNLELLNKLSTAGTSYELEKRYRRKNGSIIWVQIGAAALRNREGKVESAVAVVLDITERKRSERLFQAQKQSLEMVVKGTPLPEVLTHLALVVEEQSEGQAVAAVLLMDGDGRLRNGASPSLPEEYAKAVDGLLPDPDLGTCCAAAALRTTVVTPDIGTDPRWRTLKDLPLGLGLQAAWSVPILSHEGRVLGTFGTYFRERRTPDSTERQAVEILARTAALAIERKLAEQLLVKSEEQLRAIFEASRDGILVELDERIVYVNHSYASLLGYQQPQDLIGENVSLVMSAEDVTRMLEYGRGRLAGKLVPTAYDFKGKRKDGVLLDLEASVSTHTVDNKTYITTAVRDITDRKLAQEALRKSESKYRMLMEEASDGIHTYGPDGNIIDTNLQLCNMLGYTREELLQLNVKNLIPPEEIISAPIQFDELKAGKTLLTERRLLRKDGKLVPVEISGRMIEEGVLQSIIRDITERKRTEEATQLAHEELETRVKERTAEIAQANEMLMSEMKERQRAEQGRQELLRRLVLAQEEERRNLSRELHDQMGQQLTAIMMGLKTLNAASYKRPASLILLKQVQDLTDELGRELHSLALALRPPALEDLGLSNALYNYVEEWAERSRVHVDFHSSGLERRSLPLAYETTIYRIVLEALTNVVKHAQADQVSLILERTDERVVTIIEDNGIGFDIEPAIKEGKLGLLGMRERAALLGGTVAIESTPGSGTSVFVRIPLEAQAEESRL